MRALANYIKEIEFFNIPFSLVVALIIPKVGKDFLDSYTLSFFITLLTGGHLLALFFYELRKKHQYFFYYNKGFSKITLISLTFVFHLSLLFLFILIKSLF